MDRNRHQERANHGPGLETRHAAHRNRAGAAGAGIQNHRHRHQRYNRTERRTIDAAALSGRRRRLCSPFQFRGRSEPVLGCSPGFAVIDGRFRSPDRCARIVRHRQPIHLVAAVLHPPGLAHALRRHPIPPGTGRSSGSECLLRPEKQQQQQRRRLQRRRCRSRQRCPGPGPQAALAQRNFRGGSVRRLHPAREAILDRCLARLRIVAGKRIASDPRGTPDASSPHEGPGFQHRELAVDGEDPCCKETRER
mmetsp:Transcript_6110/g.12760  ORF Transcript_6110/g.12760 Transcript_6110/m.12760 type:complete len:251 (+) Transcript_6110:239-991(+)